MVKCRSADLRAVKIKPPEQRLLHEPETKTTPPPHAFAHKHQNPPVLPPRAGIIDPV